MAELLITASLDPIKEREIFPKGVSLPRHVTVWQYVDVLDNRANEFIAEVGNAVEAFSPFEIEGAEYDEFGPNNDIPVRRVKMIGRGATLLTLHTVLGTVVEKYEAHIPNPELVYAGYSPHVTYKDGRALEQGEHATLSTVELIEKNHVSKDKFVRKIWKLEEA